MPDFPTSKPIGLFLLHLPPPVHGSSVVGMTIRHSSSINEAFRCKFVNLLLSKNVADSGGFKFAKIFASVKSYFSVAEILIRSRPSFCYFALTTSGLALYRDVLLVALLKAFRVRIIYHLHNRGVNANQVSFLPDLCYRFLFKGARAIVLSKLMYADIKRYIPENQISICHNGVKVLKPQVPACARRLDRKYNLNAGVTKILFLANLIKSKGVFTLLKALYLLQIRSLDFRCEIIGDEGDISSFQLYSFINKLGLDNVVRYHGPKLEREKEKEFLEADIFAFPTYYPRESFPLVLLEAMYYSLPVVSTLEGGIPDMVQDGETGFLVHSRDEVQLADKLELLIKNPSLRLKMGAAGKRQFDEKFTVDHFENRLATILADYARN